MKGKQIKIEFNENITTDLVSFLTLLKTSLSLNLREKFKILYSMPNLSQKQVDDLIAIFYEESEKMNRLSLNYPLDIKLLETRAHNIWQELSLKLNIPVNLSMH